MIAKMYKLLWGWISRSEYLSNYFLARNCGLQNHRDEQGTKARKMSDGSSGTTPDF
jgi:hypothetical protein